MRRSSYMPFRPAADCDAWAPSAAETHVGPKQTAKKANTLQDDGDIHEQADAQPGCRVATAGHLVVDGVAILAAVPPEIMVARRIDHGNAGQARCQPVEGAFPTRMAMPR